jgi:cell division protein FtsL
MKPHGRRILVPQSKKAGLLVRILLLALLVYMVFMLVSVRQQIAQANEEISTLTEQVSDQTQTNTELANAVENRDDPSFIKDVAREKLGLVSPNDKVIYITD